MKHNTRGLAMLGALLFSPVSLTAINRTFRPRAVTGDAIKRAAATVSAFYEKRPRPWRGWSGFSSNGLRTRLRLERIKNSRRSAGHRPMPMPERAGG